MKLSDQSIAFSSRFFKCGIYLYGRWCFLFSRYDKLKNTWVSLIYNSQVNFLTRNGAVIGAACFNHLLRSLAIFPAILRRRVCASAHSFMRSTATCYWAGAPVAPSREPSINCQQLLAWGEFGWGNGRTCTSFVNFFSGSNYLRHFFSRRTLIYHCYIYIVRFSKWED